MSGTLLPANPMPQWQIIVEQRAREKKRQEKASADAAAAAAIWPDPAIYTPAFFAGDYSWCQPVVDELRALKFPGTYEVWQKDCAARSGLPNTHLQAYAMVTALNWVKGQAKLVARTRCGLCARGRRTEEPTYTEAFEALVLAEMPAALAEKEAAVTAEALRRIKAEAAAAAAAAEKQRVETARITVLARQRIKQAAEKAAEEAAIQLEMARLLSTDETVAARIQLRGAELSGLF